MEDALEHVGISPQVSSSLINGNSNSNNNNKDVNELLRFSKAKGIEFNRFGLEGHAQRWQIMERIDFAANRGEEKWYRIFLYIPEETDAFLHQLSFFDFKYSKVPSLEQLSIHIF